MVACRSKDRASAKRQAVDGRMHPDFLSRDQLVNVQRDRLCALCDAILPANQFYARKFGEAGLLRDDIKDPADLEKLPFTTKTELSADQEAHPPYGSGLTYPRERYCRLHHRVCGDREDGHPR